MSRLLLAFALALAAALPAGRPVYVATSAYPLPRTGKTGAAHIRRLARRHRRKK